jgi:hypothetical protein
VIKFTENAKIPIKGEYVLHLNKEPAGLPHHIMDCVRGANCLTVTSKRWANTAVLPSQKSRIDLHVYYHFAERLATPSVIVRALISVAIMPYLFIRNFLLQCSVLWASFVRKQCQLRAAGTGHKTITPHRSALFIILLLPLGF